MKSRGMVIAMAAVLAAVATIAVFAYLNGVKHESTGGGNTVAVVVSKQDVPAGTDLDGLIGAGTFTSVPVPQDLLVRGAVTSLTQLQHQRTGLPIIAGQQISTALLQGQTPGGGLLGIPDGMQAVTLDLDTARAAGGVLQQGDHVAVYASGAKDASYAIELDSNAKVLRVTNEEATSGSSGTVLVTLALTPRVASHAIFAQQQGSIWLGLLPPRAVSG